MKQYTLLTSSGINKLLKTASDGSKITLKEVVVSDFEGELSEQTTSIPNEKYRGAINAVTINENDNNILDVDAIIPPEIGGFYIKTAGIYCDDGSLFAVARLADTYKPLLSEGSSKDITLSFRLQIANANESIVLKVDNNVVLATRKWSDATFLKKTDKIDTYTKAESDDKFALKSDITDGLKIGSYLLWSSQSVTPAGFLTCDGRSLKKSEYAELFAIIGYTYGGSDGDFNIPKFNDGRFMRGTGGNAAALGTAQGDAIRNITGTIPAYDGGALPAGVRQGAFKGVAGGGGVVIGSAAVRGYQTFDASRVVPTANENRPYNSSMVVLIKAKDVKEATASEVDKTPYATEAKAGIVKLKNSITGQQEDVAVSEKAVAGIASIGINQTWQDMTEQRQKNITYTNTTGRPILIKIMSKNTNVRFGSYFEVNGAVLYKYWEEAVSDQMHECLIPVGQTYKYVTDGSVVQWFELR